MRKKTFYAGKKPYRNYKPLIAYSILFVAAAAIITGVAFGVKAIVNFSREKKESRADNYGEFTWETAGFEGYADIKCLDEAFLVYKKGGSELMGLMTLDGTPISAADYTGFSCVQEPWRTKTFLAQKPDSYKYVIDSASKKVTSKQYRAPLEPAGTAFWATESSEAELYDSVGYIGKPTAASLGLADGLYPIESHDGTQATGSFGYVDENLALAVPLDYSDAREFAFGLGGVCKGDECGYLGVDGKAEIGFDYESVSALEVNGSVSVFSFSGGRAPVMKGGKMGIINTDGKTVVDFDFDIILPGEGGVYIAKDGGKWGKITVTAGSTDADKTETTTAPTTLAPDVSAGLYIVNTSKDPLNIRAEASPDATIVAQVPKGTVVEVSQASNGWAFVKYHSPGGKDFTGWAKAQYLLKSESATTVAVTSTTK